MTSPRSTFLSRHALLHACAMVLLFAWSVPVYAQEMPAWAAPSDGPASSAEAGGDAERPPDFPPAPLDPLGLGVLAAAGAALAVRRLRNTAGHDDRGRR
ncbi:MAG: hypothetical protein ABJF88_06760 [Rhodothermales bacterium]